MSIEEIESMRIENARLWQEFEFLEKLTDMARAKWVEHSDKVRLALHPVREEQKEAK